MPLRRTLPRLALAAIGFATGQVHGDAPYQQAQDMPYGVVLYDYFRGNYFDALSTLMVAEQRGTILTHSDNAALIEGGISLGFGLGDRAEALFHEQLQQSAAEPERLAAQRALAWRRLAELSYRRGDWSLSAEQLQRSGVAEKLPLAVSLALRGNDLERAAALLEGGREFPPAERVLGYLNLAAAHARDGQYAAATRYYQRAAALADDNVGNEEPDTASELAILRDRAYIGAGYSLALQEEFASALAVFRQVRLNTPWAARALLGLGWTATRAGQPKAAIDAFHFLQENHPDTPEAREALVALSHAYEQLQQPATALAAYQRAEQHFEEAIGNLQALQSQVASRQFHIQAGADRQRYGWLQAVETPDFLRENQSPLQRILESDGFQLRLAELRDLRQLSDVVADWQAKLPQFAQLIDARGERRQEIVAGFASAQYDQQLDLARSEYRRLAAALDEIERNRDGLALLAQTDGEAAELLGLVESAQQKLAALENSGRVRDAQRRTLARAEGLLLWEASQQYHHNLWQQQRALAELDEKLEQAEQNHNSTARTANRAPRLRELQARLDSATPELSRQGVALDRAAARIEASIREDVLAELARQRQQTVQYLAHSRLAIARLQDQALQLSPSAAPEASDG